jgi:mono/diheme cytochrome c family protein
VVSRGFPRPPSFFEERLRSARPELIVSVITNGVGRMSSYAERIPPEDRWAIAHYIKALQAEGTSTGPERPVP